MSEQGYGAPYAGRPGHGAQPSDLVPPTSPAPRDPAGPPRAPHRPWSTVLLVVHSLSAALGALMLAGGVAFVLAGARQQAPSGGILEPWSAFFGGVLAVAGLLVLVVSAILTALTAVGRRAADRGRSGLLLGTGITVVVIGGIGVLGAFSGGDPLVVLTFASLPGLYCLTGVALLRRLRPVRPPVVSDGSSSLAAWH